MTTVPASLERPEAPLFSDGIGDRVVAVDAAAGDLLQILRLRPALLSVPSFEFALRERAARLANFRHVYYARVRRVDRYPGGLAVVADHVEGTRLSEILRVASERRLRLDINAALCLIRQLVPSVALLHENARDVAHGLIAPERLIMTPNARLVVADHVLGSAVEQLQYGRERLWQELRVALPQSAGAPRFDHRADVNAVGLVSLALILGRPLAADEYPHRVPALLHEARALSALGDEQPLPPSLRAWLARALQLDARRAFISATEAQVAFEEVLAEDTGLVAAPVALETFLSRYIGSLLEPPPPPVAAPVITVASVRPVEAQSTAAPVPPGLLGARPQAAFATSPVPPAPFAPSAVPPAPIAAPTATIAPRPAPVVPRPVPAVPAPPPAVVSRVPVQAPALPQVSPAASAVPGHTGGPSAVRVPPDITALLTDFHQESHDRDDSGITDDFDDDEPIDEERATLFNPDAPFMAAPRSHIAVQRPWRSGIPHWRRAAVAALAILAAGEGTAIVVRAYRKPATPMTGMVSVQTNPPGVSVFVDGVARGNTPARLSLAAGSHIVELRGRGVPRVLPVTVTAGAEVSQYLEIPQTPTTGSLLVQSEPAGARVSVDAVERGVAPVSVPDLAPGDHEVVLQADGGTVRQHVVIQAGVTSSVLAPVAMAAAAPASGWLSVKSPVLIEIREGGRMLGTTDSDRIMMAAGRHQLELVNETLGYHATRAVQVPAGKVAPITIELPQGTINLNASPWAEVWIDGRRAGETPIGNLPIAIGPHEIVFRHPQLGEKREAVSVTLNSPVRLSVDMK